MTDERSVAAESAEAHRQAQKIEDWRTRSRLRAEVWARAYSAEFTGLRTGVVRDTQDADLARQVARNIADAVAGDFDDYCRRERLP
jgi:hypothetical protein